MKTITYSGGLIPDDQYDDFTVTFYTPTQGAGCSNSPSSSSAWSARPSGPTPGGQEPDPAPQLTLAGASVAEVPMPTQVVVGE